MKKILLYIVAALCICSCGSGAEDGYTIDVAFTGDLSVLASDTLIVSNSDFADTVVIADGKAVLEGKILTPNTVTLYANMFNKKYILTSFFLENCGNTIVVDLKKEDKPVVTVKGGTYVSVADSLQAIMDKCLADRNFAAEEAAYKNCTDNKEKAVLYRKCAKIWNECDSVYKAAVKGYVEANPTGMYSLVYTLRNIAKYTEEERDAKIAAFQALPQYEGNKNLEKMIAISNVLKSMKVGNKIQDFTQNDPDGNPVKFSDIYSKNKITMVDFWASWCGPCRAFNPTLLKIYDKYHSQGFEVFGVSYDSNKEAWVKCIESEKLPWPQVSDLKGWKNETSDMFYIKAIPENLFVDNNGIIIGYKINRQDIEEFIANKLK